MSIASELRGPGLISLVAKQEYKALTVGQPLVLTREPMNHVDPNAVIAKTAMLQPVAYVAKEHAAMIAPHMDRGRTWIAVVTAKANAFLKPQVSLQDISDLPPRRRARIVEDFKRAGASQEVAELIEAGDYMMPDDSDGEAM